MFTLVLAAGSIYDDGRDCVFNMTKIRFENFRILIGKFNGNLGDNDEVLFVFCVHFDGRKCFMFLISFAFLFLDPYDM